MPLIDFTTRTGTIDGLVVITMKQANDDRGTVRELFRRSAFGDAALDFGRIEQVNLTETHEPGAVRGMHAESMTKLVTVAHGRARGVYVDARPQSPTFGVVEESGEALDVEPVRVDREPITRRNGLDHGGRCPARQQLADLGDADLHHPLRALG